MSESNAEFRATSKPRSARKRPLDIAIIGMACRFPGARDLIAFWKNVVAGRDCTSDVPPDRWDPAVFYDPDSTDNDRVYCRRGGYLDDPIGFDPSRHGVMPLAVEGGEPEQFLVLDAARAALDDAGLTAGLARKLRVEVVIGRGNYFNRGNLTRLQHGRIVAQTLAILQSLHPEWSAGELEAVRADLKVCLPPFEAGTIAGQVTNATAGRIADRLDLSGASYVVDAASASSLVALDLGARALVDRRADLAIVGGVYLASDVDFPLVFTRLGALSRSGVARPFSNAADGTLPGEGVGVVVLKRLADAERDEGRVYAVIKGVGVASDGRGAGLAAPSARGHFRAISRAYRRSGIDPATVGLVEGHGLGLPAADLAELRALNEVFPASSRGKRALGAVSALIGHAMPAAGMAGLIKAALSLHHRLLPPNPNADDPHPLLGGNFPFALNGELRPWLHGETAYPRRAGVNAFGFAGINAHALLEEHTPSADGDTPGCMPEWDCEAILMGAPDRDRWVELARALLAWLDTGSNASVPLKDLAYTLNTGQGRFAFRVGMVSASTADFRKRLSTAIDHVADPKCRSKRDASGTYFWDEPLAGPGRLAFLYPGEGSQYPGMLADLCPHFPELRAALDTADRVALRSGHDLLPSDQLFSKSEGAGLWQIETAVNVVLSSQWALHQLLTKLGLKPDAVVGHSSGEFLALAAAGAIGVDRDLEIRLGELGSVFEGLERSGQVPSATLVAVAADRARVEAACREAGAEVSIAIDNCPHQVVIAGEESAVALAVTKLKADGILHEELPFKRAYHTPQFASALGPIRAFYESLPLQTPRVRIYSCATAEPMPADVDSVRKLAVDQWISPVAFRSAVEAMHRDGVRLFIDVGARGNLAGFVEDSLRGRPHFAVAANMPRRSGIAQLNHLVASLYAQGLALRPEHLYSRRRPQTIDFTANWEPAKPESALAVGFPEMRLSEGLIEQLKSRRKPNRVAASSDDDPTTPPPRPARHTADHHEAAYSTSEYGNGATRHTNGPTPRPHATFPGADDTMPPTAPKHPSNGHHASKSNGAYANGAAAVSTAERPAALVSYFETMDEFLETQRQVMDAYLRVRRAGNGQSNGVARLEPTPIAPTSAPAAEPPPLSPEVVERAPVVATVEAIADVIVDASAAIDVCALLLDQVSRRTGYPIEMLDLDLDMEADLGIDSIKRVEIFGELQSAGVVPSGTDLETLSRCRTLGQIVKNLGPAEAPQPSRADVAWVGEVKSFVAGREIVALRTLDVRTDPVAEHHTLGGRRVSDIDTKRLGYPVVPFTVMAELLAQAASTLVPGQVVTALRGVQANRWMAYEAEPITLELRATRDPKRPDEVECSIKNLGSSATSKRRAGDDADVQGVVVFAASHPARPQAPPFAVKEPGPCRFTADELYRDQWLFHGPALQALTHVGAASPHGIEGTLRVLPLRDLFPDQARWPRLHIDPIVLDAFTHLLGAWGLDKQAGEEGDVMFPLRLGELAVFGGHPPEGAEFDCRITIREITRHRVHAEADIVGADGRVWMRVRDWFDWRFYWPGRFRDVFRQPKTIFVGEPLDLPGAPPTTTAVWLEPPGDMGKPVWRDVLEWVQLSPAEREANRALGETEPGLSLRIWGRVAMKEAARRLWLDQGLSPVFPADLAIEDTPDGHPRVRPVVPEFHAPAVHVVVAEAEGVVVAAGTLDPALRLGLAVERLEGRSDSRGASFSIDELGWLDLNTAPGSAREEWATRFGAAKAAVTNALAGQVGGSVIVTDADRETGELTVGAAVTGGESLLKVSTARRGDCVWAFTSCERIEQQ